MDQAIIDKMQKKLEKEKARLQDLLHSVADTDEGKRIPGKEHDVRYEDVGTDVGETDENVHEREEYEVALSAAGSMEDQLKEVEAALERIETDTYGICSNCNSEIPEARLEANPAATECIDCSERPSA